MDLSNLKPEELELVASLVDAIERRERGSQILNYFPEDGPLRRELYKKHLEFFGKGATHRQRLFMCANRVGKSYAAGCELVYHLTGRYPDWWTGHRFTTCNQWWVVGDTSETVRQILQNLLLGPVGDFGTGLIPMDTLDFESLKDAKKAGTPVGTFRVRHVNGTYSTVAFKSSEQGRKAFQGVACSIWIDEECPMEVYQECLLRTMTGGNLLMATFTPLRGMSEMVKSFLTDGDPMSEGETGPSKYVVRATWDDAPHLSQKDKDEMLASIPEFQRDARARGIPVLGAGAIFPVERHTYVVEPFAIPKHWPKAYGLDVGRNTAAIWIAKDPESNTLYTYSEHFQVEGTITSHIEAINARGNWIRGAIDTAARGRSQTDGENLFQIYTERGLRIVNADKAVEAGLYEILELLTQGRLKVFSTCSGLLDEIRSYHRDENGKIIKKNDHRMDAWRYAIHTRDAVLWTEAEMLARTKPQENRVFDLSEMSYAPDAWMA